MKQKRLSTFPNLLYRKRSFLFGPGEQILDQIETINSQQNKFVNDTKTFWFPFQNDIGTFVLTCVSGRRKCCSPRRKRSESRRRRWSVRWRARSCRWEAPAGVRNLQTRRRADPHPTTRRPAGTHVIGCPGPRDPRCTCRLPAPRPIRSKPETMRKIFNLQDIDCSYLVDVYFYFQSFT